MKISSPQYLSPNTCVNETYSVSPKKCMQCKFGKTQFGNYDKDYENFIVAGSRRVEVADQEAIMTKEVCILKL